MRGYLNGMKKCRFAKSRRPTDRPRSPRAREATKNRPTVEGGIRARARRPVDAEGADVTPRVRIFYLFAPFGVVEDAGVVEEVPPGVAQGGQRLRDARATRDSRRRVRSCASARCRAG